MGKYFIKYLLISLGIIFYGCQKVDVKTYTVQSAIEMSMRYPEETEVKRIIQVLTDRIDNGNSDIHLIRGFYYLLTKDTSNALMDFNFVLKSDSTDSDAYLGIAITYFLNSDTSLYYLTKALKYNPNNAYAYFYRATFQPDDMEHLNDLNKAIKLNPNCAMFYTWRGAFYDGIDSIDLAVKDWYKSTQLDDSIPLNYALLGIRYKYQNNFDEALKNFSLQIKVSPNNINGYENRGDLFFKLKQYNNAILDYKEALQCVGENLFSNKSTYYYAIAKCYALLKNDSIYHYLELTFDEEADYANYAETEKDFDSIRNTKQFKDIIIKYSR